MPSRDRDAEWQRAVRSSASRRLDQGAAAPRARPAVKVAEMVQVSSRSRFKPAAQGWTPRRDEREVGGICAADRDAGERHRASDQLVT
jgi:hypothetical protein